MPLKRFPVGATSLFTSLKRGANQTARESLLWTNTPGDWPVGIADAPHRHFKNANRIFSGHDAIAYLVPNAVFEHCGVTKSRRPCGNLPDKPVRRGLECEITDVALGIRMHRVGFLCRIEIDRSEGIETYLAVCFITFSLYNFH